MLKIKVHHVGGIGDCGPAEVINMLGEDVEWIIYDADKDSLIDVEKNDKKKCTLINNCIGGKNEKVKFNIFKGNNLNIGY